MVATDKDGAASDTVSQDITVENLKPTAEIHGATSGVEGTGIVLTSTVSDPGPVDNASAFAYLWTITRSRDGGFTYQSYDSATTAGYTLNPDDDGLYHVTLVATDKDEAASDTVSQDITVENVAPTATLGNSGPIDEGTSGTVTFSNQNEPSPADNAAGLHYAYDFNNDGDFTDAGDIGGDGSYASGVTSASTAIPSSYLVDGMVPPVGFVVHGRIIDKDGGYHDYTTLVTVRDVAPTIILSGDPSVNEGSVYTLTLGPVGPVGETARDPIQRVRIIWGNGIPDTILDSTHGYAAQLAILNAGGTISVQQTYTDGPGSPVVNQIQANITNDDGVFPSAGVKTPFSVVNLDPYGSFTNEGPYRAGDDGYVEWFNIGDPSSVDAASLRYSYDFNNDGIWDLGNGVYSGSVVQDSAVVSGMYLSTPGTVTVKSRILDKDGGWTDRTTDITVLPTSFRVLNFTPNDSGFDVQFNHAAELSTLNLYQGLYSPGNAPDIQVVNSTAGNVKGSMVWNASTNTMSFVKTGGALAADTYTVTLVSGVNAWKDTTGSILDGDSDYEPGVNYTKVFTVASSSDRVVSLPDFARGAGQVVNIPATGTYLPINIDIATGVTAVDVWVEYDPTLLHISNAIKGTGVPGSWALTVNNQTPGLLKLSLSGPMALTGTNVNLIRLIADVPATAPYRNSEVIKLTHLRVNEGNISAKADYAIHKALYLGDADGSQKYDTFDSSLISRVVVNLDSGFDSALWTDPLIVGDATGDGTLSALDASYVAQKRAHIPRPEIPDLPPGVVPLPQPIAVDPQISIPLGIAATPGGSVNVPVDIAIVPGIDLYGVYHAGFDVFFDPNILQIATKNDGTPDVSFGSFWPGTGANSWSMVANLVANGDLIIGLWRADPPSDIGTGTIANMLFTVNSTADAGTTPLLVSVDGSANDHLTWTDADGSIKISSTVEGRNIFYNNSRFDRTSDDAAIASNKSARLPGQTTTFANYTSYSRGINGIMVDIKGLPVSALTKTDFVFKAGNDGNPGGWDLAPDPISVTVRPNAGANGSDRVTIIWDDNNDVKNKWLQVTVKANDSTGLAAADVFYFGNLVGESGDNALVDIHDEEAARNHRTGFTLAPLTNFFDYNRDGQVNASDDLIARHNDGASLWLLSPPLASGDDLQPVGAAAAAPVVSTDAAPIVSTDAAAITESFTMTDTQPVYAVISAPVDTSPSIPAVSPNVAQPVEISITAAVTAAVNMPEDIRVSAPAAPVAAPATHSDVADGGLMTARSSLPLGGIWTADTLVMHNSLFGLQDVSRPLAASQEAGAAGSSEIHQAIFASPIESVNRSVRKDRVAALLPALLHDATWIITGRQECRKARQSGASTTGLTRSPGQL